MLHRNDFRSIWELSHVWAGCPLSSNSGGSPDAAVVDKLQKIIWAFLRKKISLRRESGRLVPPDNVYLYVFNLNRTRTRLVESVVQERFDQEFLSGLFVMRSDVLKCCSEEFLDPPSLWGSNLSLQRDGQTDRVTAGRHRDDEVNKLLCQAIARTLWDLDPQIHPAHMLKHKAIRKYANGALYKDDETIRGWIFEVDPLRKERKTGRPPAVRYLIDIENGGLNPDCVIQFKDGT